MRFFLQALPSGAAGRAIFLALPGGGFIAAADGDQQVKKQENDDRPTIRRQP
jgi:hypothetical protein